MYTALLNEESVTARDCTDRTLDYLCPECRSQVILKRGKIKVPHFAHKDNFLSCDFGKNESESHLRAKDWLYQTISAAGYEVHAEYKITNKHGKYIFADIYYIPTGTDMPIAVEVLTQGVTVQDIEDRIRFYNKANVAVLWIVDESFYKKTKKPEFSMSAPIQYLYKYYYNNLYVFDGTRLLVYKVKNAIHIHKGGYDQYGDFHPDTEYTCKTLFNAVKVVQVDLTKHFSRKKKDAFGKFPAGYVYLLKYEIASSL